MNRGCVPCQGIRQLTPRQLFQRAGLTQLHYRVGDYADFFESMLAALGSVRRPKALDQTTGVLARLRTRERDDPSIALVDAWAVIADVLTFYQERIANEAFLNTATQPASLHELARLLGYAPRPGLSSSVLLSFQVDERSEEVLIPRGTKAQSTPIPGSGHQPQVFETTQDFTARAEWNVIRPRLSRPQALRQDQVADVTRIYLLGVGLRIKVNDWIAIGERGSETVILKQVTKVEERRETAQGPLTIAHVGGGPFSAKLLVDEFANQIAQFFAQSPFSGADDDAFQKLGKGLKDDVLKPELLRQGLKAIDLELQTRIEAQFLKDAPGNLRNLYLRHIAATLELRNKYSIAEPSSSYQLALEAYKAAHSIAKTKLGPWAKVATELAEGSDAPGELALRRALNAAGMGPVHSEQLVASLTPLPLADMAGQAVFEEVHVDSSLPAQALAGPFQVKFAPSSGVKLSAADNSISAADLEALAMEWKGVTRTNDGGAHNAFIRYHIFAGEDPKLVGAGVHEIRTQAVSKPLFRDVQGDVPGLARHRILINERHDRGFLIDRNAEFAISHPDEIPADATFVLEVALLAGEGQLRLRGPFLPVTKTNLRALGEALNAVYFVPTDDTRPQTAIVGFSVSLQGQLVFHGVRTLLIDAGQNYVRREIAGALNDPTRLRRVKVELDATAQVLPNVATAERAAGAFIENQKLTASKPLLEELNLATVNDKLDKALQQLRQELTKIGQIQPDLLHVARAARFELPEHPLPNRVSEFDSVLARISADIADFVAAAKSGALERLFQFGSELIGHLARRRRAFVKVLSAAQKEHLGWLERDRSASAIAATKELKTLFAESSPESDPGIAVARIAALNAFDLAKATGPNDLSKLFSSIGDLQNLAEMCQRALTNTELAGDAKRSAERILASWSSIFKSVESQPPSATTPTPDNTANDIDDVRGIMRRIAAGEETLSAASASAVFDMLQQESQLWAQVVSALNPREAARVLANLRAFRNVTSPQVAQPRAWIFRSQANLFGWNSPGKLAAFSDDNTQLVMKRDAPGLKPEDESDTIACLDGKFGNTSADGPIAIQRPGIEEPQPFWILGVKFNPRSAYELSGNVTNVTVDPVWWPSPHTAHDDFGTIRGTRVWCDAEELALAEALLPDDEREFRIADESAGTEFELNDFHPFLSAGSTLVITGIPSPDRLPPNFAAPMRLDAPQTVVTEIATIAGLTHDFDESLYGDAVRTKIVLERPLSRHYWRDTVEIAANVVAATHGETVRETLGSGEARKAFQRFELSSTPLTRLPAADADGQEPQLDVRVNKVLWKREDRLLDLAARAEAYELRSARDGKLQIQFGDGAHGSRLPSGLENVKAIYRKGLGLAGNVEPGRIDQLPGPPPGVRSVSNPIAGDGGADPDKVQQSKLRLPRSPIRAGRLISLRDYESFALLFAGVEKVKATRLGRAVRLTVAGETPGPLRTDGELMRSLVLAMARYGDPQIPVTIAPHVGRLLYIEAALAYDDRVEWSVVQEAVRSALIERFGYRDAQLGRPVLASEVVETLQNVAHVRAVNLKRLSGFTAEQAAADVSTDSPNAGAPLEGTDQVANSAPQQPLARVLAAGNELCYVADAVDNAIVLEPQP